MPISRKRRRRSRSMTFAKTSQMSTKNSCTTVEVSLSLKSQTTDTSSVCSMGAWTKMALTKKCLTSFGTKID
tara:strand:+ start:793 stop:1008 length:216 start_codon:yes stop_codon:yes gene_type:complete